MARQFHSRLIVEGKDSHPLGTQINGIEMDGSYGRFHSYAVVESEWISSHTNHGRGGHRRIVYSVLFVKGDD